MSTVALVVDDSMLIRYTVCRFLEEHGFTVEAATDGMEALEILSRVRMAPTVTSTETFVYLKLRKQTYSWGTR